MIAQRQLPKLTLAVLFWASGIFDQAALLAQSVIRVPQDVATLDQAVSQVGDGGIIELAAGTYAAPLEGFRWRFLGKGFTVRAAAGANVVLSGNDSRPILRYEDNSTSRTVRLENLTFRDGFSDDENISGGISLTGGRIVFSDCTFADNRVTAPTTGGGALWVADGADVLCLDCTFTDNQARTRGGALSVQFATVTLRRNRFTDNRTNIPGHVSNAIGGAIFVLDATLRVEQSRFEGNQAAWVGGAIYGFGTWQEPVSAPRTLITLINSTFVENLAAPNPCCTIPGPASGGAIHVEDQVRLRIEQSRFLKNRANWGGAISSYRSDVELADTVFRGNLAALDGPITPLGGAVLMASADSNGPSTNFGAINRPTGRLQAVDTLFQGRFEEVEATAAAGGCVAAIGDTNRQFGEGGVSRDDDLSFNRMDVDFTRVIFADCDVAEPTAGGVVLGGGIYADLVDLDLESSLVFDADSSASGGGIAILTHSTAKLRDTTIAYNRAEGRGGGVLVNGSHLEAENCQFIGNETSPGVDEPIQQSGGAALFSAPVNPAQALRRRDVTGKVETTLFTDNIGLPIVETDFAAGPINDLRYNNNRFSPTTFGDRVFQNTLVNFGGHTVSELNSLVVSRSNGTSTDKSQVANQALATAPNAGALVAAPSLVLAQAAAGDPAPPTDAFLGYAWRGPSASIAGQRLPGRSGLFPVTDDGTFALRVAGAAVDSTQVRAADGIAGCAGIDLSLCLNRDRFQVEVAWRDFANRTGSGQVVPVNSPDSGLFFFFNADNWEMLVKVLNGCNNNGRYWVFAAATTNVEYTLTVTDTATGEQRRYFNPLGNAAAAITDNRAFNTCSFSLASSPQSQLPVRLDEPSEGVEVARWPAWLDLALESPRGGNCIPGAETLCLNNDRFRVTVDWVDFRGNSGSGEVVPFGSADSGLFYFFNENNWEMLIKVLRGCTINNHYWVFAAATTNVQYTLRIEDTQRPNTFKEYFNPLGQSAAAITDIRAFATCP